MLEVNKITKYYKRVKGIENLSFTLSKGEALGIIGINGSGKTTTFRILLRLLKADSGTILFNKKNLKDSAINLFGYLPEERSLFKDLSVFNQVMFLGRLKKMKDEEIEENLNYYLNKLEIAKYKYTNIYKLSKGNQQKVQIICALIHDPKVVILDEPLSGLDIINVELLKRLIKDLKRKGKYVLLSSHQFKHIEEFCENVIILKSGNVMYSGSIESLVDQSDFRYLLVDKEVGLKYIDKEYIKQSKSINKLIEFKIEKADAKKLFEEIVLKESYDSISLKKANVEAVVREKSLI